MLFYALFRQGDVNIDIRDCMEVVKRRRNNSEKQPCFGK